MSILPEQCHVAAPCSSQRGTIVGGHHATAIAEFARLLHPPNLRGRGVGGVRDATGKSLSPVPMVRKRILIADDEPDVLALLETRLSASGFEVLKASDGVAAMGRARTDSPALAVLDVMMPGMSGLEVCRALKADPKTARMPIILLTARDEVDDRILRIFIYKKPYHMRAYESGPTCNQYASTHICNWDK